MANELGRKVLPVGPTTAKIMIVGEAPGREEERSGAPFVGASGQELTRMLGEVGIARSDCFITNVARYRPEGNDIKNFYLKFTDRFKVPGPIIEEGKKELYEEIKTVQPNLIIALGDTALWATAGKRGPMKWRGSVLPGVFDTKVIPTIHPAAVLRMWDLRHTVVQDLRRCAREATFKGIKDPGWIFHVRPGFKDAVDFLNEIIARADKFQPQDEPVRIASDLETMCRHISCHGIAISKKEAMCIPFMTKDNPEGYWAPHEEVELIMLHHKVLRHPNVQIVGQNYTYDAQHFWHHWILRPRCWMDTMIAWHCLFPGEPKSLDYISSLMCEHYSYWKDELEDYHSYPSDEHEYWTYNCKDVVYTYEDSMVLEAAIRGADQQGPFNFQMRQFQPVLQMTMRGVLINQAKQKEFISKVEALIQQRAQWFKTILPDFRPMPKSKVPWYDSTKQLQILFYEALGLPKQFHKKTKKITTDDSAIVALKAKEPLLKPFFNAIQEYRSLGVFMDNFLKAKLDTDGRMRCFFSIAGPETFRYSSSKNAFGNGTNLQNIPEGNE